jgi:hypothetical protein
MAAKPAPVNRGRNYLEKKSYNVAVALRDRRAEATRFATNLFQPFTNNERERSRRMAKLHKKIRGCFQAEESALRGGPLLPRHGSQARPGGLDVLSRLFRGDVWMPPATT